MIKPTTPTISVQSNIGLFGNVSDRLFDDVCVLGHEKGLL